MAVYGIGAYYEHDITRDFLKANCICIGYQKSDATTLYEMLRRAKLGDIIYIKSTTARSKNSLYIKAVGFIIGTNIREFKFENGIGMGFGREVLWVRDFSKKYRKITLDDEDRVNNVYSNTIYEEYSKSIIMQLVDWIIE